MKHTAGEINWDTLFHAGEIQQIKEKKDLFHFKLSLKGKIKRTVKSNESSLMYLSNKFVNRRKHL